MDDRETLLVDIGNTRLKWCARADADGSEKGVGAIAHAEGDVDAQWTECLVARPWRDIWIASVARPPRLERFEQACNGVVPGVPRWSARSLPRCGDLRVAYRNPAQLGVDRFLAMIAARGFWPRVPVLIASIGSALTIDLVGAEGGHTGGLIAPTPQSMQRSLASLAPQLADYSSLPADVPATEFALDTAGGIASGCAYAAIGLIEHCRRAATLRGDAPMLVLTGGGAGPVARHFGAAATFVPQLVLAGLARYARLGPEDNDTAA